MVRGVVLVDSVWKKVDVLSFDSSCFNFTSVNYGINIKSFCQVHPLDPLNQNNKEILVI